MKPSVCCTLAALAVVFAPTMAAGEGLGEWEQCAGEGWKKDCASGLKCDVQNEWYGQCVAGSDSGPQGPSTLAPIPDNTTPAPSDEDCDDEMPMPSPNPQAPTPTPSSSPSSSSDEDCDDDLPMPGSDAGKGLGLWEQCAGNGWKKECADGMECEIFSEWYGQCRECEMDLPMPTAAADVTPSGSALPVFAQCAGQGWKKDCASGLTCEVQNEWYGQCVSKSL